MFDILGPPRFLEASMKLKRPSLIEGCPDKIQADTKDIFVKTLLLIRQIAVL